MKKQKPLANAKKPTAKAKKETVRPIPRREKKTARKPAKCEKATEAQVKEIRKKDSLADAFFGLLEDFGVKPTFIKIETKPESPKPKKKASRKKAAK